MSKKPPKALGLNEPFRHPDHSRPRTRREFVAQGFLTGAATIVGPSLLGLLANPRDRARRRPLGGHPSGGHRLRHHHGRRQDPVHLLRPGGRRQHRRLQRAGRRPEGPARFSLRGRLQQAGPPRRHGAESQRHRQFHRQHVRPAVPLGQRAPARHEDTHRRQGHGQHHGHGDPGPVAERHQRESAQSHVWDLPIRRARRPA